MVHTGYINKRLKHVESSKRENALECCIPCFPTSNEPRRKKMYLSYMCPERRFTSQGAFRIAKDANYLHADNEPRWHMTFIQRRFNVDATS